MAGERTVSLLQFVQESTGRLDCKLVSVVYFHQSLGGGVAAISPIAGWVGFGGDLTDDQVNAFGEPVLAKYRIQQLGQ